MNSLEEMIMEEISSLPDMQLINILGFIRFLKSEASEKPQWIEQWFDGALKSINERPEDYKLTPEDIQAQIQKRRDAKK